MIAEDGGESSNSDGDGDGDGDEDRDGDGDDPFGWTDGRGRARPIPMSGSAFLRKSLSPPAPRKMLYIQMVSVFRWGCTLYLVVVGTHLSQEFVERQTLREVCRGRIG